MKLTKNQIVLLYKWLNVPLHGDECRKRNQCVALVKEIKAETETKRDELLQKFTKKDETGKAIIKADGNYDIENYESFAKEFNDYLGEEVEVDSSNKALWRTVSNLLTNEKTAPKLGIELGELYEELMARIEHGLSNIHHS